MSMSGHEVHTCEECSTSDYDCFMKKKVDPNTLDEYWFCEECFYEDVEDPVDATEHKRNGGWR